MKNLLLSLISVVILHSICKCQEVPMALPFVDVETIKGEKVNVSSFFSDNKALLIIYSWGCSWGPPCLRTLDTLNQFYKEWEEKFGIKAISINAKFDSNYRKCYDQIAESHEWTFPFYWDDNDNFWKSLNNTQSSNRTCPWIIIVNSKNQIVYYKLTGDTFVRNEIETNLEKIKK
jgi:thiol-disulfide isomerase/thioredoxin